MDLSSERDEIDVFGLGVRGEHELILRGIIDVRFQDFGQGDNGVFEDELVDEFSVVVDDVNEGMEVFAETED